MLKPNPPCPPLEKGGSANVSTRLHAYGSFAKGTMEYKVKIGPEIYTVEAAPLDDSGSTSMVLEGETRAVTVSGCTPPSPPLCGRPGGEPFCGPFYVGR